MKAPKLWFLAAMLLLPVVLGCGEEKVSAPPSLVGGVAIDARRWALASPPPLSPGSEADSVSSFFDNAQLVWFNPRNVVKQKDLHPDLARPEDGEAPVQVLSLWVPRAWRGGVHGSIWCGLTQSLGDGGGLDLSSRRFLVLWVNDFRDFSLMRNGNVHLHVDLGQVGEDQQRRPDETPNHVLDGEDRPPYDRWLSADEDVGLDQLADSAETDLVDPTAAINGSPADPHGDNWSSPDGPETGLYPERDPRRWRFLNGTERNQPYRAIPDTEDLDGDGQLDTENGFYRYAVDTLCLDTDVYEKYASDPSVPPGNRPAADNGWRRYVIPLDDARRQAFGNADLHRVKYLRVWLEGLDASQLPAYTLDPSIATRPLLELAEVTFTGSR